MCRLHSYKLTNRFTIGINPLFWYHYPHSDAHFFITSWNGGPGWHGPEWFFSRHVACSDAAYPTTRSNHIDEDRHLRGNLDREYMKCQRAENSLARIKISGAQRIENVIQNLEGNITFIAAVVTESQWSVCIDDIGTLLRNISSAFSFPRLLTVTTYKFDLFKFLQSPSWNYTVKFSNNLISSDFAPNLGLIPYSDSICT